MCQFVSTICMLVVSMFLCSLLLLIQHERIVSVQSVIQYTHLHAERIIDDEIDNRKLLFIHIPKSGGTALTAILRVIQCHRDPIQFRDCCHNPGSCYIKGFRRCISILGCVSHHPRT